MASAIWEMERVGAERLALPAWWRQTHTYALAGLTALNIAGSRAAIGLIDYTASSWLSSWLNEALIGAIVAQGFLLGLWAALGGLSTLPRWGIVGFALLAGMATMSAGLADPDVGYVSQVLEMSILGAMFVLAFAACLLPLRGLAGWRIDFDPIYYRDIRGRRGQLSFMDYAAYSLGIAATLAAARLALQAEVLDAEDSLSMLGIVVLVLLLAGPVTWVLVAVRRRLWLVPALLIFWPLVLAAGNSWLIAQSERFDLLSGGSAAIGGLRLHLIGFYYGAALLIAATLVPLRLFGLKLIVVPLPAGSRTTGVGCVEQALGTLPRPLRP